MAGWGKGRKTREQGSLEAEGVWNTDGRAERQRDEELLQVRARCPSLNR